MLYFPVGKLELYYFTVELIAMMCRLKVKRIQCNTSNGARQRRDESNNAVLEKPQGGLKISKHIPK